MTRALFLSATPILRMSLAEFEALPLGCPADLHTDEVGRRWLEPCCGSLLRVREWRGVGPDGYLIDTYRPIIRVRAISRMVPRPQVAA